MEITLASPGPAAAQAYRLGLWAGALLGIVTLGGLYWSGAISPLLGLYVLIFLFPVYLVVVAAVLSVWLGYDKDATALRPVYREK